MTSKELFSNFIRETIDYPYFSTLYDLDMWREDKERIENDLEVLDILKKLSPSLSLFTSGENPSEHSVYNNASEIDIPLDERQYSLIKNWLEEK